MADQCTRRMRAGQSVVTLAELEPALEEIGSVQAPGNGSAWPHPPREATPRVLQQVSEGAVISGVCLGLARYFRLDVTLLRVISVLLLLGTGGAMVLVYLGLMLLMPYAPLATGRHADSLAAGEVPRVHGIPARQTGRRPARQIAST